MDLLNVPVAAKILVTLSAVPYPAQRLSEFDLKLPMAPKPGQTNEPVIETVGLVQKAAEREGFPPRDRQPEVNSLKRPRKAKYCGVRGNATRAENLPKSAT